MSDQRAPALWANMSERQLQDQVLELAQIRGWLVYHTHDARRSQPGFPDLVLLRDRVVFVELKSQLGQLTPSQLEWLTRLWDVGAEAHVWRPSDWYDGDAKEVLM